MITWAGQQCLDGLWQSEDCEHLLFCADQVQMRISQPDFGVYWGLGASKAIWAETKLQSQPYTLQNFVLSLTILFIRSMLMCISIVILLIYY